MNWTPSRARVAGASSSLTWATTSCTRFMTAAKSTSTGALKPYR